MPQLSDSGCKTRLLRHLDQCIAEIETEICPRLDPVTVANATAKSTISDKAGYVCLRKQLRPKKKYILQRKRVKCE